MRIRNGIRVKTNDVYFNLGNIQLIVSSRYMKDSKGFRISVKKCYETQKDLIHIDFIDKLVEINPKLKEILEDLIK